MCACEPGYVCSRCEGTPLDDRYPDDEHEPPTLEETLLILAASKARDA